MEDGHQSITADEIARHAGVRVSAIANWRSRHADFPAPVLAKVGRRESFPLDAVVAWLDGRRIPQNRLADDEASGATYGSRLRRGLGMVEGPLRSLMNPQEWAERVWQTATRYRGGHDPKELARGLLSAMRPTPRRDPYELGELNLLMSEALDAYPGKGAGGLWRAELYDALLRRAGFLDDRSAKQVATPASLARLLVHLVIGSETGTVLDPCMDSAAIPIEVIRAAGESSRPLPAFTGLALTSFVAEEVRTTLDLSGTGEFDIGSTGFPSDLLDSRYAFDAVLANPPFNLRRPGNDWRSWPFGRPPEGNANYAWLQLAWAALAEGGCAAVVLPVSSLSAGLTEKHIRAEMIRRGAVEAVITLPGKLFAATSIPVCVWILRKGDKVKREEILLIEAARFGRPVSRSQIRLTGEDVSRMAGVVNAWRCGEQVTDTGFATVVSVDAIEASDWLLLPGLHLHDSLESRRPSAGLGHLRSDLKGLRAELESGEQRLAAGLKEVTRTAPGARETFRLREVCMIRSGPAGRRLEQLSSSDDAIPVVTPKDLSGNRFNPTPSGAVSWQSAEELARYRIRPDDILLSRVGDLGRVAVAGPEQEGWVMGPGCFLLRVKLDRVDPGYLAHYLRRPTVQEWIKRNNSGSAVAALNPTVLGLLAVDLPSRTEQRRISEILRALDETVSVYRRLADTTADLQAELSGMLFEPSPVVPAKYLPIIWVLERLPHGVWVSYKDLAELVGSSPQTVGSILREAAYVPNGHRILQSNGKVSPEWATNDGLLAAADVPGLLRADGVPTSGRTDAASMEARMDVEGLKRLLKG